jgi:hypothetical protein
MTMVATLSTVANMASLMMNLEKDGCALKMIRLAMKSGYCNLLLLW